VASSGLWVKAPERFLRRADEIKDSLRIGVNDGSAAWHDAYTSQ